MVRKFVAGFLLVAGFGILAYALGDASVFAQVSPVAAGGTNSCCVRASTLPVTGGTCGILLTGADKKDLYCDISPTCAPTANSIDADGNIVKALHVDGFQNGGCVRQGFKVCSFSGTTPVLLRRGLKSCASGVSKNSATAGTNPGQVDCRCVFIPQGSSISNRPSCSGDRCN